MWIDAEKCSNTCSLTVAVTLFPQTIFVFVFWLVKLRFFITVSKVTGVLGYPSRVFSKWSCLCHCDCLCHLIDQVMFLHHSDQMYQRSQVSGVTLVCENLSLTYWPTNQPKNSGVGAKYMNPNNLTPWPSYFCTKVRCISVQCALLIFYFEVVPHCLLPETTGLESCFLPESELFT